MTYSDLFAQNNLPRKELWPIMEYNEPWLQYPKELNCAEELLDKGVAAGFAKRTLCHFNNGSFTYSDLLDHANRIARVLVEDLGLVSGNRVLIHGANSPIISAIWFAVLKAGGICVTTMPLLRAKELSYIIDRAKISIALSDLECISELEQVQKQSESYLRIVSFNGFPDKSSESELEKLAEKKANSFVNVRTQADDVALIAFTSGTTGKAKATVHFHRDVMAICDSFPRSTLKPSADDIFIGTPPLAFTFGLGGVLLFPMRFGASTIFAKKTSPEELVNAIDRFKASVCFSSPTGYRAMIPFIKALPEFSLKTTVSAGETLPLATYNLWKDTTGIQMIDGIGATEMLHIFISASGKDIKPGTTGKAIPGYYAKIVGSDGQTLPAGELGLLAVRGPTGCRYLMDEERQSEYVRNGWNFTGDAYVMDEEGYLHFHARADDMIVSSGYNISGPEVENALLVHPKVKECGVVAAPDSDRGNIVKAYVVLKNQEEASLETVKELQEFVKKEIAPYKYPRAIEFVSTLPRTETGKLQRFKLRG